MKIAIVHDFLNQYGGAERVVGYLNRIFPEAPVFTSIYFPKSTFEFFRNADIHTSFLQKMPGADKHFRKYFLLYPAAFKKFDLSKYDVIITSSSSYANSIKKTSSSLIISYCYTPARFLWNPDKYLEREKVSNCFKFIIKPFLNYLKKNDLEASKKVDYFITISDFIKERVKKIYGRDSTVIYPPIDSNNYIYKEKKQDFYLVVSRLKSYKRVDIAVKAFNMIGKELLIAGTGEDEQFLKKIARRNIKFLGRVSEARLTNLYSDAKALIFTGEEDFGLTPIEAQASGTPVIAFRGGGALETIIAGQTGLFYDIQDPVSLIESIKIFEKNIFDPSKCRANALKFDYKIFKRKITEFVNYAYKQKISNKL